MEQMRVSDYIASFLLDNGIQDVFSVVGGGAMFLNDSLGHKDGLTVTYNHHEQACAIAAEGYARATQHVAAVCVTTGPGGTNAITGVLGAYVDSVPMMVISGQVKYSTTVASTDVPVRQLGDQEWRITDTVREMTKYAVMVTNPKDIAYHLEKALWMATNGRPGPCWIDVPINVQSARVNPDEFRHFDPSSDGSSCLPDWEQASVPSVDEIDALLDLIGESRSPVVLAGGGIRTAGAYDQFLEFIEALGVPVCTAWNAHDLIPDAHPLYAGRPGTVGTRGGNFALQNADLVISLACRMNIRQISYNWENFAKNARLVAVDIDKAELEKPTLHVDVPIHADIRDFFEVTLARIEERQMGDYSRWAAWCRRINERFPVCLPGYREKATPVNPYVLFDEIGRRLPEEWVTVTSNGSACVCSFQAMHIKRGQRLFTNSGMASMGYGLPAAIGAAVALDGNPVLCIEGDGSLMMNLQELETVAFNGLNVKVLIVNNNGYHSIRQTQTNSFDANYCGLDPESGVGFPLWERVAYAFDIPFSRVDSLDRLGGALDAFLFADGPTICEVVVGQRQFFEPKLSSRRLPDGSIVSPSLEDMSPFLDEEELAQCVYSPSR